MPTDSHHVVCPACSTRLRVREKIVAGRKFACPECQTPLHFDERGGIDVIAAPSRKAAASAGLPAEALELSPARKPKSLLAQPAANTAAPTALEPLQTAEQKNVLVKPEPGSSDDRASGVPPDRPASAFSRRVLAFFALGACLALAVVLAVPQWWRFADPPTSEINRSLTAEQGSGGNLQQGLSGDGSAALPDSAERRFERLGRVLGEQLAHDEVFPRGTIPSVELRPQRRLSWLAAIVEAVDGPSSAALVRDRPWNDPVNDAFVRRRIPGFQNPAVRSLTGADGYPATHFVGCAGVGAEAPRLEAPEGRAGVFGYDRQTRAVDIRDGLANAILILGVDDHLGSWAAGGQPTVRALVSEPYLNGPDGFGTGEMESMLVLMADGSVRAISARADPRIVRRMAAIADGLPLDEATPGEPGDVTIAAAASEPGGGEFPANVELAGPVDLEPDPEDRPLEPEFGAEPGMAAVRVEIDVARALEVPIVLFDQPRSRPLAEVLEIVAELAGAGLELDRASLGSAAARLDQPAAVHLEKTTVGGVLEALLRPNGLWYKIDGQTIRLVLPDGDKPPQGQTQ